MFTGLALFGGQTAGSPALVGDSVITALQYALILAGVLTSLYTVFRLAQVHA